MSGDLVWLSSFRWREKYIQRTHQLIAQLARDHRILYVETRFSLSEKFAMLLSNPRAFFRGRLDRTAAHPEDGMDGTDKPGIYRFALHSVWPRRLCAYFPPLNHWNGVRMARLIAERMEDLGMRAAAVGTCHAAYYTETLRRLPARLRFYDCIDEHGEFLFAPPWSRRTEATLVALADRVFATSRPLQRSRAAMLPPPGKDILYSPNGVDLSRFLNPMDGAPSGNRRPRIGFAGYLGEWADFGLLEYLMRNMRDCDFVLAGEAGLRGRRRLRRLIRRNPNCLALGLLPYAEVPALIAGLDAAIIPFRRTRLVQAVSPIKLFEYAALGVPVVATRWDEIEQYRGLIHIAEDGPEFLRCLRTALASGRRPALEALARANTWESRAATMAHALAEPA
jgi:glycosyltransferase involved in cell wall biosynthesis